MGNKITKWIELHIPSGPSGLLQFPVPNHAPTITTTQQPAEYHSLYLKIGFRFSNGLLGIEMKAEKCRGNVFHLWDAMLLFSAEQKQP